jgi:hypothetical protein
VAGGVALLMGVSNVSVFNDFMAMPAKNTVLNVANTYDKIAHTSVNNQNGNTV